METNENYQIICKIKTYFYENIIDISTFKNGCFCLLYSDNIEYYSNKYQFLYYIPLDYGPTHLLTLAIKSKLYVIIRNIKSLYLYLLEDNFIYKTRFDLKDEITFMTKAKNNQIIICSKNKISFYEIKDDVFKAQNDIIIEEERFIENSLYFKTNKEIKEKIKEKESNISNLLILKIFELEDDYIIIIKKELYEIVDITETSDCPCCCAYIHQQTKFILLSIIKLNKKNQKMKNIYEFEIKFEFENKYYYDTLREYFDISEGKKKSNQMYYFDDNIINSIELFENKVLFYNPELNSIEIININSSSFEQKYKSILYHPGQDKEKYKINFLSENCFYLFKYIYDRYSGNVDKSVTFIDNNKEDDYSYEIFFIKIINSLLFVCGEDTLTISKKLI